MKKALSIIIASALCIMSFVGCGGSTPASGNTPPPASPASGTPAAPATTAKDEPVTIEYWQYFYESKIKLVDELIAEFQKANPNITVVHKNYPYDNYEQKLAASMTTGKGGPNIINVFYGWVPKYVQSGVLQELPTDRFDPAAIDKDFSPMVQINKIDGKYYTIPTAVRTSALFYNLDILESEGYSEKDLPKTLEEYAIMSGKLAKWNGSELIRAGSTWQPTGQYHSWLRPVLMEQYGGKPISADGKTANWNSPAGLEAFKFFLSLPRDYKVGVDKFYTDDTTAFSSGNAAFHIDGSFRVGTYKKNIDNFKWGVTALPTYNGVQSSCGTFWTNGITARTTGPELEASIKFLEFLTSPEVMKRWTQDVGELGARISIAGDPELTADPIIKPFIDALPYATSYFYVNESADRQILLDAIDRVMLQNEDPKASLDKANTEVQKLLDDFWSGK